MQLCDAVAVWYAIDICVWNQAKIVHDVAQSAIYFIIVYIILQICYNIVHNYYILLQYYIANIKLFTILYHICLICVYILL